MLTSRQFSEVHANTLAAGDTVHAVTGERPEVGFMVAKRVLGEHVPDHDYNQAKLMRYALQHGTVLQHPANYLGTWHDKDTGHVDLDVSTLYPDIHRASMSMVAEGEKAAYNLSTENEHRNPVFTRDNKMRRDRLLGRNVTKPYTGPED